MKKIRIAIVIVLLIYLAGCSKGVDKGEVQKYADPMVENMLNGMNTNDYQVFSKDFSPMMLNALSESVYHEVIENGVATVIGKYERLTLEKVSKESNKGQDYITTIYRAKFSDEPGDVAITVWFSVEEDPKIETLLFNSPKLVESSMK